MAKTSYLGEHRKFFGEITRVSISSVEKGQVIRFNYAGKERNVFVVHGQWKGKLHGMDLAGVPRNDLLPIVNADSTLTEHQLYDAEIKNPRVLELNAYRTYDRGKIANLRRVHYDSTLQPTERGEGMEDADPFVVTDQSF